MQLNEVSKISELAKSLYQHRLVGSMEEAAKLAEQMIGQDKSGEKMSAQSAEKEIPVNDQASDNSDDYPEIVSPDAPLESYDTAPLETDSTSTPSDSDSLDNSPNDVNADSGSTPLNDDSLEQSEEPERHKEESVATSEQEPADEWLESPETITEEENEEELEDVSEETEGQKSKIPVQDVSPIDLSEELEGVKLTTEGAEHVLEDLGKEVKSLKEQLEANTKEFEEIKEYLKDIEAIAENSKDARKKEQAGLKTSEIADKPATEIDGKLDL